MYCQLEEVTMEIEKSKREAFLELSKRKKLEYDVAEAISTVTNDIFIFHAICSQ